MRDYAALPHEYWEEMADLTDEEWGRLTRALLKFSMTGEETPMTGNERFFWRRVVNREERYQKAFQETAERNTERARNAANKRWNNVSSMPEHAQNANTNTNSNSNSNTKSNTKPYSKTNSHSRSSGDETRFEERMHKDILELERFMTETKDMEGTGT